MDVRAESAPPEAVAGPESSPEISRFPATIARASRVRNAKAVQLPNIVQSGVPGTEPSG